MHATASTITSMKEKVPHAKSWTNILKIQEFIYMI